MKDLLIYHNLGLGDHILTNGLVRHFAKLEPKRIIHVPCKAHNCPSVKWMFSDVDNISVTPVTDDLGADKFAGELEACNISEVLRLSASWPDGSNPPKGFDEAFYLSAGVPFEERWSGFYAPPSANPVMPLSFELGSPYVFAHEDKARGFIISHSKLPAEIPIFFTDDRTKNIFDWMRIIYNAREIHCIPSSFSVLVDSAADIKQKLFLHASARSNGELPTYRKNWTIL